MDKTFEPLVDTDLAISFTVDLLVFEQLDVQLAEQLLLAAMLRRGHVEVEHRMPGPIFLQFSGFQPVEQFRIPREVTMDRR